MAVTAGTNTINLGGGRFIYDVFRCRYDYVGIVAPYWCRPAFDGMNLQVNGESVEWFALPDSRQFTLSILARIPRYLQRCVVPLTVTIYKKNYAVCMPRGPVGMGRLAMVTMVRQDARYLAEWIRYHHTLGFQHFYIYNHTKVPEITAVLKAFGNSVTEIPWHGRYGMASAWSEPFLPRDSHCYTQCPQMMHAALKYGDHWDWMGFFDADEFLVPQTDLSISGILAKAERHAYAEVPFIRSAALEVQGKWFGTSGHSRMPRGSVVENYTQCEAGHTCGTKAFIQPHAVTGTAIHYWDVVGQTAKVPTTILRFNHYRAISPFKNRIGQQFDDDWTNEITDTRSENSKDTKLWTTPR